MGTTGIGVSREWIGPTTNACQFINYEHKFDLNNPYIPIEEEYVGLVDEWNDAHKNEAIEEVDNVPIGEVV